MTVAATAATNRIPFQVPNSAPFTVSLVLPATGNLASHKKTESGDCIYAHLPEGKKGAGLIVEITDSKGRSLWSHDFGFNDSSPEGCGIEVSYDPTSRLLLLHYAGYKADQAHKLLFVEPGRNSPAVREYKNAQEDILPFLKRQKDFPSDYNYVIYPLRFAERGVEFECIPIQKPERQAAHPFAQDQHWYLVTATINANRKLIPTDVKPTQ